MKKWKIKPVDEIVDELIEDWDIKTWVKKKGVLEDISNALQEAYMIGAYNASKNSDLKNSELLEDAKIFVKGLSHPTKI